MEPGENFLPAFRSKGTQCRPGCEGGNKDQEPSFLYCSVLFQITSCFVSNTTIGGHRMVNVHILWVNEIKRVQCRLLALNTLMFQGPFLQREHPQRPKTKREATTAEPWTSGKDGTLVAALPSQSASLCPLRTTAVFLKLSVYFSVHHYAYVSDWSDSSQLNIVRLRLEVVLKVAVWSFSGVPISGSLSGRKKVGMLLNFCLLFSHLSAFYCRGF